MKRPNYFVRTWLRFCWHLKQFNLTFSNSPSHYSSKRIERAILFITANTLLITMSWWLMKHDKLDYMGAIGIYGGMMFYCGYQTTQIRKDKNPDEKSIENTGTV